MRVLLVTHYYPDHQSGVPLVAGELAARWARRGVRLTWAASGPPRAPLPDGITPSPMRAWSGIDRLTGFGVPLWSGPDLRRLADAVAEHDLVQVHEYLLPGSLAALNAARRCGVPVVLTQHTGQIPYSPRLPILLRGLRGALAVAHRTLARWALGGAARCVFISAAAHDYFCRIIRFRRPPLFLPNGVSATVFRPLDEPARRQLRTELGWSDERPVLLFVGRWVEKKGLPLLRELAGQFPDCDWAFAGWGPVDPASWGLPNVRVLGRADHATLARYYQAADLFVLPSLTEGFPLVVQEAMACGTPAVLSTDIAAGAPGVESVIPLWEPKRESLADVLRRLLAGREDWPAGRVAVASYARTVWDWERCADEYLRVFEEAVKGSSVTAPRPRK